MSLGLISVCSVLALVGAELSPKRERLLQGSPSVQFRAPYRTDCVTVGSILPIKWYTQYGNGDERADVTLQVNGNQLTIASNVSLNAGGSDIPAYTLPNTISANDYIYVKLQTLGLNGNQWNTNNFQVHALTDTSCVLSATSADLTIPFLDMSPSSCFSLGQSTYVNWYQNGYNAATRVNMDLYDLHSMSVVTNIGTDVNITTQSSIYVVVPTGAAPHSFAIRATVTAGNGAGQIIYSDPFSALQSCPFGLYSNSMVFRVPASGTSYSDCIQRGTSVTLRWYHAGWPASTVGSLYLVSSTDQSTFITSGLYPTAGNYTVTIPSDTVAGTYKIKYLITSGSNNNQQYFSGGFLFLRLLVRSLPPACRSRLLM
jgi:hypothetical protein